MSEKKAEQKVENATKMREGKNTCYRKMVSGEREGNSVGSE